MHFQVRVSSAIILRELANCLYEDRNCFASAGKRPPPANPRMAETPAKAFPAAGGRRSGRGWRLRRADRGKARREPADRQRTPEDPPASWARAGQAHQTVDVLQARRNEHQESEATDCPTRLDSKYFRTKRMSSVG